jgi:hypothetical protein
MRTTVNPRYDTCRRSGIAPIKDFNADRGLPAASL